MIFTKFSTLPANIRIYKRVYSHCKETDLFREMESLNWHEIFEGIPNSDPSLIFDSFYTGWRKKKYTRLISYSEKTISVTFLK